MEQKIIRSEELESCLAAIKKERNVHHALLVCGNSFRKQGLYQQLEDALKKEGMELTEFSDFEPNPKYESVISGIKTYRQKGCDLILAAGGGSAMDVAKCIKLFNCMNVEENCLKQEIISNEIPFLAIPTTAGTGSEATRFAVIYYEGNKKVKHIYNSDYNGTITVEISEYDEQGNIIKKTIKLRWASDNKITS